MIEKEPISKANFRWRKIYHYLSKIILPTTLKVEKSENGEDGLEKATSLIKNGSGLVIIYTHPSRTDPFRLMEVWAKDELAMARCLIPIAYHQDKKYVRKIAKPTGVEFSSIVTEDTVTQDKNNGLKVGHGRREYLEQALTTLSHPGLVLLAPSTARTPELALPEKTKPTDILLNAAHSRKISTAVMFTGFEINGVTSYERFSGLNIFRRYTLHIGNTFTNNEIREHLAVFAKKNNIALDPRRPFNGTDLWAFNTQLPNLVPPSYHPKSSNI